MIADVMLYNIEIAQTYSSEKEVKQESFYTSMLKSFDDAMKYIRENGLLKSFLSRIEGIVDEAGSQHWFNKNGFERVADL